MELGKIKSQGNKIELDETIVAAIEEEKLEFIKNIEKTIVDFIKSEKYFK